MFAVTTVNLSNDTRAASATHGANELGMLGIEEFTALVERFQDIDSVQNHEAEPHLLVVARAGKFIVRTSHRRLFLYDGRDTTVPATEMTAEEMVSFLDRNMEPAAPSAPAAAPATVRTPNRSIALAILIAGLSLNGYTLYSVVYTKSVNVRPPVTLLTGAAEREGRLHDATGIFATGNQPGDRAIEVQADGRIRFFEIGANGRKLENDDTFRIGRHDDKLCLTTAGSGIIDIVNIDTFVYFRDTYRRVE